MMRIAVRVLVALLLLAAALFVAVQASPWPGSLAIRWLFDRGAADTVRKLTPKVPAGIDAVRDEVYDGTARLDVFRPVPVQARPTVVWIHGGGFVSGRKEDIAPYAQILAARGYAVVSIDYTIAPEASHPEPLRQAHRALAHLVQHAERLGIDPQRLFLAGDSAGALLAAQVAAMVTSPPYAQAVGIAPTIAAPQLRGLLLYCGPYDLGLMDFDGPAGFFLRTVMWAYVGNRDFQGTPAAEQISVLRHVTAAFPPAFISVGNADPLRAHSKALAERLGALGVGVDTLFYADGHEPRLGHEYQFDLDLAEGRDALERSVRFLERYSR